MKFIEIVSKDLDVIYIQKDYIVCIYTHKGEVIAELEDGMQFRTEYREVKETDTMFPMKTNKHG